MAVRLFTLTDFIAVAPQQSGYMKQPLEAPQLLQSREDYGDESFIWRLLIYKCHFFLRMECCWNLIYNAIYGPGKNAG